MSRRAAAALCLALLSCSDQAAGPEYFTRSIEGLEAAKPMPVLDLKDGDTVRITAAPVKKSLNGMEVRMLAYNGSVPGPLLRVPQGATIILILTNKTGEPTTLHPHGLRLDQAFDGTPASQRPIPNGGTFAYRLTFPDPGIYWYHPHLREDYGLEMGLSGNFLVTPRDSGVFAPVDREVALLLDDVLLDDGGILAFRKDVTDHSMMGRFGNVYMANGDTALELTVKRKEVVRFYATNACNSRVLNLALRDEGDPSRYFKVVGGDNGSLVNPYFPRYEFIGPGERLIFEARFPDSGTVDLVHLILRRDTLPKHVRLARIRVLPDSVDTPYGSGFDNPDTNAAAAAGIDSLRPHFSRPPDKSLLLTIWMDHGAMRKAAAVQHDPAAKGVEWSDHPVMGMDNARSNEANTRWIVRDVETGLENHAIQWSFPRGSLVRIRIKDDPDSMHPMPHPIHFHGQRFLVTAVDGSPVVEAVGWKDTYLVGRGETVDLLLEASNPGAWMAHCHIAEHIESSMMFHFTVTP